MNEASQDTVQVNLKLNVSKYLAVKRYAKQKGVTVASLFDRAMDIILGDEHRGEIKAEASQEVSASKDVATSAGNTGESAVESASESAGEKCIADDIKSAEESIALSPVQKVAVNYDKEWEEIVKAQAATHTAMGFTNGSRAINDWLDAITLMIKAMIGKKENDAVKNEAIF